MTLKRFKKLALLGFFLSGQMIGFNRITVYDAAGRVSDVRMGANPCYSTFSAAVRRDGVSLPGNESSSLAPQELRVQIGDFEKAVSRQEVARPPAAMALLGQVPPAGASLLGRDLASEPFSTEQSPVVPFHLNSKK